MEYPDFGSVFYTKQIRRYVYEKKLIERVVSAIPTSQEVILGDENTDSINCLTVVVGEQLEEKYYISECTNQNGVANVGDYFTFHAATQYENAGGSTNTMGLLEIGFDVCVEGTEADGYPRSRSAKVELDYTANP